MVWCGWWWLLLLLCSCLTSAGDSGSVVVDTDAIGEDVTETKMKYVES